MPLSARVLIATDALAPKDRFEWWRSQFAPLHATEVVASQRTGFTARGAHFRLGSMIVARYVTPARRVVRTAADLRRDDVDHFTLRTMLRGTVVSHGARQTVSCRIGQILFATSAEAYDDAYSSGEWVTLLAPRASFPALAAVPTGLIGGVQGGLLADYLVSLDRRLDDASPGELPALAETTRAMINGCLLGEAAPARPDPDERRIALRYGVERVIHAHLASARLDAERICALTGLSRSALYRLFDGEGGVSAYVQALRLRSIDADLRDPRLAETRVATLAARWGMHNPAAFSRAYRRTFGHTPGEARRTAAGPAVPDGIAPAHTFIELLR